jgi:hypothetical protein
MKNMSRNGKVGKNKNGAMGRLGKKVSSMKTLF